MHFKRYLALLLAMALLFSGCGGNKTPPSGTVKPVTQEADPAETAAPAASETVPEEDQQVSLGSFEGGIYENTYAGFGCALGEGWTYKTAEELQDLTAASQDALSGTELDLAGSGLAQVTDMMAENMEIFASINVLYQQITPQEMISYAALGEGEIIDGVLLQKDALVSSYAQAGITVHSVEKTAVTFLGETRYAMYTVADIQGTPYYMLQIFDYKLGGEYAIILTAASLIEDSTADLLDLFYPL